MADAAAAVRALLASRFGEGRFDALTDDTDLGPAGFGLDSISLVELLLVCEEQFGRTFPFTLFDEGPITVRRLADHVSGATVPPDRR